MAKKDSYDNDELVNYYSKIYKSLEEETLNDTYGSYILGRVKGGQKTVFNKTQSEIRNFDMSFLDTIESVYPALTKIMRDPKKSIRYETEVVAVEKAKKTNSDTVRHLSSHTHLIKEITKEGDVIPSKVLTTFAEEELAIYENRFIKSLVRRIEMFLERRYEVMKVSLESFETERLSVQNEFLMSGQTVTVSIDVAIKNDLTTNVETTKEQYNRLLYIREMVQSLKGTDFMRALAKARDVLPPIMKTNILMHNPDFKLAYGLWLYLDRVDGIATNIDVKEKSYKYSANFDKDINSCMALALTAFIKNRNIDGIYSSRKLKDVKAPKPIENENLELEMNLEADNNKLEDYSMNQIMLDRTAKFFEASMKGLETTGSTYNESVRVVFRQMLDMVDQLYPEAFGVSDDEFESADLYKQLEYARRQLMIAKIVKQQKQMNLARMGREEKRIDKLISKIEDKIKKSEAKERERLEKEQARIEAQRQAALERERAKEAKRKALEKAAIDKAKEVEKLIQERKNAELKKNSKRLEDQKRMAPALEKKREHLKELREAERGKFEPLTVTDIKQKPEDVAPAAVPRRRRDEYDDLSDDELEALMADNELLDAIPEAEDKPAEETPKEAKPKAEKKEAPKKKASKKSEEQELEDLSDDDLEALLGLNGGMGDFSAADLADDIDEPVEEEKPKARTIAKKAKEEPKPEPEQPKEEKPKGRDIFKKREEPKAEDEIPDDLGDDFDTPDFDNLSDDELDALMAANDMGDDLPPVEEKPKPKGITKKPKAEPKKEEPKEEAKPAPKTISRKRDEEPKRKPTIKPAEQPKEEPKPEPVVEEPVQKPIPAEEPEEIPEITPEDEALVDSLGDEFDNMSDEELEALLAANDLSDDIEPTAPETEAPAEEPTPEPAEEVEPETDEFDDFLNSVPEVEESSGDSTDDTSDDSSDNTSSSGDDDDFENMSDEELEALMAANDMDF